MGSVAGSAVKLQDSLQQVARPPWSSVLVYSIRKAVCSLGHLVVLKAMVVVIITMRI